MRGRLPNASPAAEIAAERAAWLTRWDAKLRSKESPITPYHVMSEFIRVVDPAGAIVTHDSGSPRDQLLPFYCATRPRGYLGWGKSHQLGTGLGLTIGAKVAAPDKFCVNFMGDAAFGMTGLDIETAVRAGIPSLTIVLNNNTMAIEIPHMKLSHEMHKSRDLGGNFADTARSLGAWSERVTDPDGCRRRHPACQTGDRRRPYLPARIRHQRRNVIFSSKWSRCVMGQDIDRLPHIRPSRCLFSTCATAWVHDTRHRCRKRLASAEGDRRLKKLINDPRRVVREMLEGLADITPGVALLDHADVIIRADLPVPARRGVALISGGGAGHEPAHAGYVGSGMLHAAVVGDVFTSPSVDAVLAAIQAVGGPRGVVLIVKNYTGDRLNFGLAAAIARTAGIPAEIVVVADDVALRGTVEPARRRGIAGTVLVHKVAGALAEAGASRP